MASFLWRRDNGGRTAGGTERTALRGRSHGGEIDGATGSPRAKGWSAKLSQDEIVIRAEETRRL